MHAAFYTPEAADAGGRLFTGPSQVQSRMRRITNRHAAFSITRPFHHAAFSTPEAADAGGRY